VVGRPHSARTNIWILPKRFKTHLVVKPEHEETARQLFTDTDVNISIEGKRHLGAALGSRTFTEEYVTNKVQGWTQGDHTLSRNSYHPTTCSLRSFHPWPL
jgi:hypothetical protein